jgi:S1-C subfamily serine protease
VRTLARGYAVALGAILFAAGCSTFPPSAEDRRASFEPFEDARVGHETLEEYLVTRTAIVFAHVTSVTQTARGYRVASLSHGSAVAIASDGYFLTVGHCVADAPVFLHCNFPTEAPLLPARVVWSGGWKDGESAPETDAAILKVDVHVGEVFEWARDDEIPLEAPAVGGGMGAVECGAPVCWSARVLQSERSRDPHVTLVSFDAPVTFGDSGGPLATPKGRLIGVTASGTWDTPVHGQEWGLLGGIKWVALRPDRKFIMAKIEEDRLAHLAR